MSAGEFLGRVGIEGGRVAVEAHPNGGRAMVVRVGALTLILDLDADQAAALAAFLVEPAP